MIQNCPRCGTRLEIRTELDFFYSPWTIALCSRCGFEIGYREPSEVKELLATWERYHSARRSQGGATTE